MNTTALFGAAAALALGGTAIATDHHTTAQDRKDSGEWNDETWSANDDRAFEMMFESRLQRAFAAIDSNDDMSISRDEWGAWQADEGFYAERFDMFDADDDDRISWGDYKKATMSMYDTSSLTQTEPMETEPMDGEGG